jgi:hypothetical protein
VKLRSKNEKRAYVIAYFEKAYKKELGWKRLNHLTDAQVDELFLKMEQLSRDYQNFLENPPKPEPTLYPFPPRPHFSKV